MEFDDHARATLAEILRWRRDVRHFRPDPVPEPVLERLRAAMAHAPSVGNARPWRVLRVESPAIRAGLRTIFARCNVEAARRYEGARAEHYARLKLQGLDTAPVQLAVFTLTNPESGHGLGRQTMPETLRQSTAMAIHTLWLAARAENLGLGMVSILDRRAVEQLMNMPEGWEFSALLCLGYPEFTDYRPLLHRTGWQEDAPTLWQRI
ncbi:5,6-dimethylbenzimidazole synthase [Mesobacterium sp. TK19101]|uniref:5,6-dimethylbenzimidazole synthase n=1 Tax=Mesobacterium hydrothermale TaxID=3111907 RepID=A0ABU6HNS0_9RHOB|nr:5,6-dimethylbenzimidazole synthase [Mesobacterium sp. TK19101]MEC3863078.1 5,6-dimethylbenzimidazole synthase [Mesobacterium sp. TK19101]